MASQEPVDTERTVVTTYVPAYQKETWTAHAEELDMSLSEFVRSMVQAGRRGFGAGERADDSQHSQGGRTADAEEPPSADATPGGDTRKMVLRALEAEQPLEWEALVREAIGDLEADVEESIEALQQENQIMHSGREGGYVLVEE